MRSWARMVRLLVAIGWEIGAAVFVGFVATSAVSVVAPLVVAIGLRPLIDGAVADHRPDVVLGATVAGVGLVLSALGPAAYRWTTIRMRERSIMVIQRRLLILAAAAPRLEHFERPDYWNRLQLLQRSSFELAMGLTLLLLGPLVVVQTVVSAMLLARLEPLLAMSPLLALPAAWLSKREEARRREAEMATAEDRRLTHHLFTVSTDPASAMEARVYGLHDVLERRHAAHSRDMHRRMERARLRAVALVGAAWSVFAVAYVGAVALVLRRAAAGGATPGDVVLTLAVATALVVAANQLSQLAGSALRSRTASEHFHWLADQASAVARPGDPGVVPVPDRLTHGIDLDGVTFSYGDSSSSGRAALRDVDLHLPAGGVVAIVGENGAGKTTLVKLLTGMYAPVAGRVLVDGHDLAAFDLVVWREQITAGFQDFMRFELLAAETVGVGDVARLDDRAAVDRALVAANATFVDRLPAGLDTPLGRAWEGGVDLSGGEWQKLALARSFVRTSPLLTIFDEPTASLDPQTEHALFEQIAAANREGAIRGQITVLVSHRFSTVRMADLIIVLASGSVSESGTHTELMASDGLYAELYQLQAAAYLA